MQAPVQLPEPLIKLHPGNPSLTAGGDVGEEEGKEEEKMEGEVAEEDYVDCNTAEQVGVRADGGRREGYVFEGRDDHLQGAAKAKRQEVVPSVRIVVPSVRPPTPACDKVFITVARHQILLDVELG